MSDRKVLVTARSFGTSDNGAARALLEAHGFDVKPLSGTEEELRAKLKEELPDADAVIAGLEAYDAELIRCAKKLKIISRYGVGYDKVDLEAAKAAGVAVTITPGANGDSVADLAVALMMAVSRNIPYMDASVKKQESKRPTGLELWEKTAGIIGAGRIGKGVAKRLKGFQMRILLHDQFRDEAFAKEIDASYVDFDTLIQEADYISLHSPLTPETKGMIGRSEFERMKRTAIVVNTARGGIIDEEALYEALKEGKIFGAGLDVTVTEPPSDSPLCALPNCILTPHAGAATVEASNKMSLMAAENVVTYFETGTCEHVVGG